VKLTYFKIGFASKYCIKSQVDLIKEFAGHVEEKKTIGDTLEMK
jgi:hypothetical protein